MNNIKKLANLWRKCIKDTIEHKLTRANIYYLVAIQEDSYKQEFMQVLGYEHYFRFCIEGRIKG